jgi:hypothetical protein
MKISEITNFNTEFPETFPWSHIDTISLCAIASQIVNQINHDFRKKELNCIPGLRKALNIIAEYVDL